MSKNDKEPFFVKFLKSSDNSECFFEALEVRLLDNVFLWIHFLVSSVFDLGLLCLSHGYFIFIIVLL